MPFQQPPAHIQEISTSELKQLRSADALLDPMTSSCSKELSELLSLSPKISASSLVLNSGEEFALSISKVIRERAQLALESAPLGREVGEFSYIDGKIRFTSSTQLGTELLMCKVLGLCDPSGLSTEMVTALLEVNGTSDPQLRNQLTLLRDSLSQDVGRKAGLDLELPPGTVLIAPKEVQAQVQEVKTARALALVKDLIRVSDSSLRNPDISVTTQESNLVSELAASQDLTSARLSHMQQVLEKGTLLARIAAWTERSRMDASRFITKATNSVSVFTPRSDEDIALKFKELYTLHEEVKALPLELFSQEERASLVKNVNSSIVTLLTTHRDSHLIRANYLAVKNDTPTLLKEYLAASLYENAHTSLFPGTPSLVEKIRTDSYGALLQGYARSTTTPTEREFKETIHLLEEIFPLGESFLVMNDALQTLRGDLLSEDPSRERSAQLAKLQKYSDTLLLSAMEAQGLDNLPNTTPFLGTDSERITAVKTLLFKISEVCETRDFRNLRALDKSLSHLLLGIEEKSLEHALRSSVLCNLTQYLLQFKEVRASLPATLEQCAVRLPASNDSSRLTKTILSRLADLNPALFPSEGLDFIQQQFYATTKASISIATHAALSYSILHADTATEKVESFATLQQMYGTVQSEEYEQLQALLLERDEASKSLVLINSAQAPITYRTTQGKILTLDGAISRLSRSIVGNAVELSTLALQARHPSLSKEARRILDQIPKIALKSKEGRELLERFNKYHHSDSALLSTLREFLDQSVRDKPMHTFGLMIAVGLLGAGIAGRRNRGQAFLLATSLAMLGVKTYCIATGIPMIAEAFATKLTYATPVTSVLDAMYLFTDVAQASLLIAALRNLNRSSSAAQEGKKTTLWSLAKDELYQFSRLAFSQLDPRSLGFYLIGTPISVGTYQILTSGLRSEEQFHQFVQLGYEVIPILLAALIYDRTKMRLEGPPSPPSANGNEEEFPPLPKVTSE